MAKGVVVAGVGEWAGHARVERASVAEVLAR